MNMTTAKKSSKTASPDNSNNSSSQNLESTEEIENIAKQISDHAEAIYQEWKARGLAPSEILKCHPPGQSFNSKIIYSGNNSVSSSTNALLGKAPELSNNNLNQLVNSFVVEDKARIASQFAENQIKRESCSSIKYAIKNLELQNLPLNVINQGSCESPTNVSSSSSSTSHVNANRINNFQVPDVLKDTIEKCAKLQKPEAPVKPEYLLNHIPQWPFKKPCQLHAYR